MALAADSITEPETPAYAIMIAARLARLAGRWPAMKSEFRATWRRVRDRISKGSGWNGFAVVVAGQGRWPVHQFGLAARRQSVAGIPHCYSVGAAQKAAMCGTAVEIAGGTLTTLTAPLVRIN